MAKVSFGDLEVVYPDRLFMRYAGSEIREHQELVDLHVRIDSGAENNIVVIHLALNQGACRLSLESKKTQIENDLKSSTRYFQIPAIVGTSIFSSGECGLRIVGPKEIMSISGNLAPRTAHSRPACIMLTTASLPKRSRYTFRHLARRGELMFGCF